MRKSKPLESVINLRFHDPFIVSVDDYREIRRETLAQAMSGDVTVATRVLANLIAQNEGRFHDAARENLEKFGEGAPNTKTD